MDPEAIKLNLSQARNATLAYAAFGAGIDANQRAAAETDNAWQKTILGGGSLEQDALRQVSMLVNLLRAYMRIAQAEQVAEAKSTLEAEKGLKEVAIG